MTTTVTANGVRFAYLSEGDGPLVLLLHGFPDTPHTWDAVRPALAKAGYRAVSPFLRGYHPSEIRGPFDMETLGRDALGIIDALGEKRAIIVGHDWGASAAYAAAAIDPSRVAQLVTLAIPHPASLRMTPRIIWAGRHFFTFQRKGMAKTMRANDFAYIDALVQRWSPAWKVPPQETARVKEAFRHPGCVEAAIAYYQAARAGLPKALRRRITVPSVAFVGDDDVVDAAEFARARSWYTDSYEIVRMPGGHFLHREHPERFIAELTRVVGARAART